MRRRPVLHEAENESDAKTYEADATKFGLGDLTFLKISLSLIATQPHMKRQLSFIYTISIRQRQTLTEKPKWLHSDASSS